MKINLDDAKCIGMGALMFGTVYFTFDYFVDRGWSYRIFHEDDRGIANYEFPLPRPVFSDKSLSDLPSGGPDMEEHEKKFLEEKLGEIREGLVNEGR
jgi:hypothetical protein